MLVFRKSSCARFAGACSPFSFSAVVSSCVPVPTLWRTCMLQNLSHSQVRSKVPDPTTAVPTAVRASTRACADHYHLPAITLKHYIPQTLKPLNPKPQSPKTPETRNHAARSLLPFNPKRPSRKRLWETKPLAACACNMRTSIVGKRCLWEYNIHVCI